MNRLRLLLSEALRSITASLSTTFAATVTVLIGMFLVGLLIAFGSWARSWSEHNKEQLLVKVFFCTASTCPKSGPATNEQINAVRVGLDSNRLARSFTFVSKEDALEEMRKKRPELVRNLAYNPLPHSYEIRPTTGEQTVALASSLYPFPAGVEKVCPPPPGVKLHYGADDCGRKATKRILQVARLIEVLFLIGVVILLGASTLLIANTIRLSIFARRREIEIMKLVGASNWFVRGPFMLEGLICGLAGSVAAVVLLLLGKELALPVILEEGTGSSDVRALAFELNALILVGLGLLLGGVGSALTLRRFLRI